jgi:glycosyltransferase involved in cell wall biosynthesis
VHCHATNAGFLGRIAARLLGVPLVLYTPHGWYFNYEPGLLPRRVHVLAERALARCGSLVVCTGPAEQSQALELRLAPPERIVVVPNAVEMPELSPSGPADEPQVGMVGRLSWPKDPLTFIRAAADVHGEWPKARFVLVGDGELREECMNLLRRQGSGEYVRILGHREDAAELMARFDVCVLCSYWEGMPYSLLESMALGKAVVAPGVPGCADLVTDGVTGLLFPAGDAAALARAIVRLLREPGLRDALGAAARRRAEERHSADRWIRSIEGLYAGVG